MKLRMTLNCFLSSASCWGSGHSECQAEQGSAFNNVGKASKRQLGLSLELFYLVLPPLKCWGPNL